MSEPCKAAVEMVAFIGMKYERYLCGADYYTSRIGWDEYHASLIQQAIDTAHNEALEMAITALQDMKNLSALTTNQGRINIIRALMRKP